LTSPITDSARRVDESSSVSASATGAAGDPARHGFGEADGERVTGFDQALVVAAIEKGTPLARGPVNRLGCHLGLCRRGDPIGQLVCLVDDEELVRWHDVPALDHVIGEEAVIGDDQVGLSRTGTRCLGEALVAERAPGRTDALARRHRHELPGGLVDARIELVAVAGRGLLCPVPQALHLLSEPAGLAEPDRLRRADLRRVEERIGRFFLVGTLQPGQAQVVVTPLQNGEGRAAAE